MIIFDGHSEAARRKNILREQISKLSFQPKIWSLYFREDEPSATYVRLKSKDAEEVGVAYEAVQVSIQDDMADLRRLILQAAQDVAVQGIIIQKPEKVLFPCVDWWEELVQLIPPEKDVDGLLPNSTVMPATALGMWSILEIALQQTNQQLNRKKGIVIGKSPIVGLPLFNKLSQQPEFAVELWGRDELAQQRAQLQQADFVFLATGQTYLISTQDLKQNVVILDAGAPKPELNPEGIESKVAFITPVPGGVGPMTRVSLLENLWDLIQYRKY